MINKVILVGNLGRDPELKRFDNGSVVGKFSVATSESYKDKAGEWQNLTEWHDIVVWGLLAERAESTLKKGTMVYVEGKLTTRKWQDKDGNNRYTTEVKAALFRKLERKESSGSFGTGLPSPEDEFPPVKQVESASSSPASPSVESAVEDDLPF